MVSLPRIKNKRLLKTVLHPDLTQKKYMKTAFATVLVAAISLIFAATGFGQVKVAPLDIKERTLPNGLKVVSLRDNTSPTVAIHVLYNVGSKNDPAGRNGFAASFRAHHVQIDQEHEGRDDGSPDGRRRQFDNARPGTISPTTTRSFRRTTLKR